MQNFDVVVIGGGASGIICSIVASNKYKNIAIIEKNNIIGKKLLVTGNGRCNISNSNINSSFYNQPIDDYLNKFSHLDELSFFNSLGLLTYEDEENRIYPVSNSAKTVLDVFTNKLAELNIKQFCNSEVINFEPHNNGYYVYFNSEKIFTKKLVICSGGNSITKILETKNISISKQLPSLCALTCLEKTSAIEGIRIKNIKATANCNNLTKSEIGEVLFKNNGISGICIFNLSTLFARSKNYLGSVTLDLLPDIFQTNLEKLLLSRNHTSSKILLGIFQTEINKYLMSLLNVEFNDFTILTNSQIAKLSKIIKNLNFNINGYYDNFQVISGGVKLSELSKNLDSNTYKNLYFCGEVVDVDGICGGYNLHWAWCSGKIVGESV